MSPRNLEQSLQINPDAVDECLVEQPQLFYDAAKGYALAKSRYDGAKLALKNAHADAYLEVRGAASRRQEKLTEEGAASQVQMLPRIQKLHQEALEASKGADEAEALKEAYSQRSFMLRELVAIQLAEFYNLGVERGAVPARQRLGTQARERIEQAKRERLRG